MDTLLQMGVVPIVNENDSVSTDEIGSAFGDNDRLSALVAAGYWRAVSLPISPRCRPAAAAVAQ